MHGDGRTPNSHALDRVSQARSALINKNGLCREDILAVASGVAAVAFEECHSGSAQMIDLVVMGGQVGQGDQALRVTLNRQPTLEFGKRYLVLGSRPKAGMPHTTTAEVTEVVDGKIYPCPEYAVLLLFGRIAVDRTRFDIAP